MDGNTARMVGLLGSVALMVNTIIAIMTRNHPTWEAVTVLMLGCIALIVWGNGKPSQ